MTTPPARVRPRFLVPDLDADAAETHLPPDESRHLTRVLRLAAGSLVVIFDGRGREYLARVTAARDHTVVVTIVEPLAPAAESLVPFALVPALLKGSAMDDIVRDATMMGVASIQPVITQHTVVRPNAAARTGSVERWRRIAIASAKQSRRATVPDVREPVTLAALLTAPIADLALMFLEPSAGQPTRSMRLLVDSPRPNGAALLVGPEGGWAPEEIDAAVTARAMLVTLGPLTLRADAVPMAAMATFRMLWEE